MPFSEAICTVSVIITSTNRLILQKLNHSNLKPVSVTNEVTTLVNRTWIQHTCPDSSLRYRHYINHLLTYLLTYTVPFAFCVCAAKQPGWRDFAHAQRDAWSLTQSHTLFCQINTADMQSETGFPSSHQL